MKSKKISAGVFLLFFLILGFHLPRLIYQANLADEKFAGTVPTIGDDSSYQLNAINFLNGFGFADSLSLRIEEYHLDLTTELGKYYKDTYEQKGRMPPHCSFYRAPGFPLLLSATYAIFGTETIVARRLLAALTWLTALFILVIGAYLAGGIGTVAGALTAFYYLNYSSVINFERILTEVPASFWVAFFVLLFSAYLENKSILFLILSSLCLSAIIFTRANFLPAIPFLLFYLYLQKTRGRDLLVFGSIPILLVGIWCSYASLYLGRPTLMTTQGQVAFPECNNIDVLEGIGPQRWNQGGWNPGWKLNADGTYTNTQRYALREGENGWLKGLSFWIENPEKLHRLFYVKLRFGFWYNNGLSSDRFQPEGIYLIGIGFLLLAIGFRIPRPASRLMELLSSRNSMFMQLGLLVALMIFWNKHGFWPVLLVWSLIFFIAFLRPYGDYYRTAFPAPTWFLAFIACHAITTVMFLGVRYNEPLNPPLMLWAVLGFIILLYEIVKAKQIRGYLFVLLSMGILLNRML